LAPVEPPEPPSTPRHDHAATALRPRWLWALFAIVALAIPLVGLWLDRRPRP
jgi:hypothetical protein